MRESLKAFIKKKPHNNIKAVELGVMAGANSQVILENLHPEKLFLIDSWSIAYRSQMHDRLKETATRFEGESRVCLIVDNSMNALCLFQDNSIAYVYIDDAHDYVHVSNEMEGWWDKVRLGGMLSGHDVNEAYPERVLGAVKDFCNIHKLKYEWKTNENEKVGDWWIWK